MATRSSNPPCCLDRDGKRFWLLDVLCVHPDLGMISMHGVAPGGKQVIEPIGRLGPVS